MKNVILAKYNERAQKEDRNPGQCLSFSPSWFNSNVIASDGDYLAYAANNSIFILNRQLKTFLTSIFIEKDDIGTLFGPESKASSRITAIGLHLPYVFAGLACGILCIWERHEQVFTLINIESVSPHSIFAVHPRQVGAEPLQLSIYDEFGTIIAIPKAIDSPKENRVAAIGFSDTKLKVCIQKLGTHTLLVWENGCTALFKEADQKLMPIHKLLKGIGGGILHADARLSDTQPNRCLLLVLFKSKEYRFMEFCLDEPSSSTLIFTSHIKIERATKSRGANPGSRCFLLINDSTLLMNGKSGELLSINLSSITAAYESGVVNLVFNPMSGSLNIETPFEILVNNPHFECVYAMGSFDSRSYYSLGLDRQIVFWRRDDALGSFASYWKVPCLGAKAICLAASKQEYGLIACLLADFSILIWNILKKDDGYYAHWIIKSLPQVDYIGLQWSHQTEGALYCYSTQHIVGYHIHEERPLFELKLDQALGSIKRLSFAETSWLDLFETVEPRQDLIELKTKEAIDSALYIISTKAVFYRGKGSDSHLKQIIPLQNDNISCAEIHSNERELLLVYGQGNGQVSLRVIHREDWSIQDFSLTPHAYRVTEVSLAILAGNLCCFSSGFDRFINLHLLDYGQSRVIAKYRSKQRIIGLEYIEDGKLLACLCEQSNALQVLTVIAEETKGEGLEVKAELVEQSNIRGHTGYLACCTFVPGKSFSIITAADDQTIKVWNLHQIKNVKPTNRPKKKKRKKDKAQSLVPASDPSAPGKRFHDNKDESSEGGEDIGELEEGEIL